jgi:creatinine amidohydrolase
MPTDLSFKLAARQEIFAFQEWQRGENWWGDDSQKDYYDSHTEGENPFNWICIHPFMDAAAQDKFPIDHAGEQETSLMMAFCPEGVKIEDFDQSKWFAASATKATPEMGAEAKRMTLDGMRKILS